MKLIRIALLAVAAVKALTIAARLLGGPFRFGWLSVTTPLNPEGFFGLAVTVLLLARAATIAPDSKWNGRIAILLSLGVVAISFAALRRALGIYFLSDDFAVVKAGNDWTAAMFRYSITHGQGDGFFRPVGYVSFALDAKLGGFNPVQWHATALTIHTLNSLLVMFMARRMGASALAAGFAAALFAVHGVHPEAAVWVVGRFDLLATFFLLSGLLLFMTVAERRNARVALHAAALACFTLAAFSKEAAFIFPLLVAGYALWKRQPLRWTIPYFVLAAITFGYRWSLFGGIGGYVDRATGRPAVLRLGLGSTLKAVGVRLWTSLYFPINWSRDPSLPLALLGIAYLAAMFWLALRSRPARPLWPAAAALLISVIPVLSLLAGSPTLAGSRVLYLASVWFAILIALGLDGVPARSAYALAAIALLFQFAALQHNLVFWEAASERVKAECATGAPVLPDSIDGVPAYANGRQECIEIGRLTRAQP